MHLNDIATDVLKKAAVAEIKTVKIDIDNLFGIKRETAILFAREFSKVDETTSKKMKYLLDKNKEEYH